jgi:hypothetical protein
MAQRDGRTSLFPADAYGFTYTHGGAASRSHSRLAAFGRDLQQVAARLRLNP